MVRGQYAYLDPNYQWQQVSCLASWLVEKLVRCLVGFTWFADWWLFRSLAVWLIVSRSELVGSWLVGSIMMPTLSSHRSGSSCNCMFQAGSPKVYSLLANVLVLGLKIQYQIFCKFVHCIGLTVGYWCLHYFKDL